MLALLNEAEGNVSLFARLDPRGLRSVRCANGANEARPAFANLPRRSCCAARETPAPSPTTVSLAKRVTRRCGDCQDIRAGTGQLAAAQCGCLPKLA
jgi:hypothetical protein